MLSVTKTAFAGAHLSIPQVIERAAEPYLAIPVSGRMTELPQFAPPKFAELHRWMADHDVETGSAGFFRYRAFHRDGRVELEVGTTTAKAVEAREPLIAASLPAGRYASATYTGPYDRLYDAFCMLNGWMGGRGLTPGGQYGPDGEAPTCRLEIYRVSPTQTNDATAWKTELLVKLAG